MGWGGYVCAKGALPDGTPCGDEPNPCTVDTCQLGICEHDLLMNCNGPCGGEHPFDAGDDDCGIEDSCDGGIAGDMQGGCTPTCPDGMCYQAASGNIDLTINERAGVGGCISSSVPVSTGFAFVSNAELKLKLQHEALGDLQINLIDPQGARHRIWHNLGESNDGFANTFDLSFPVPYPGIETSGQPMCALKGEQIDGIWTLQVCDTAEGNSGVLQKWSLYLKGSDDVNLNKGHRCDDAIDLGNQDVNPAIFVDGTLECALDTVNDSGCGGVTGPDRMYKFNLTTKKRVTIKLLPVPGHRLILFMKGAENGTCAAGSMRCGETTSRAPSTCSLIRASTSLASIRTTECSDTHRSASNCASRRCSITARTALMTSSANRIWTAAACTARTDSAATKATVRRGVGIRRRRIRPERAQAGSGLDCDGRGLPGSKEDAICNDPA